ncbi:large conductance mechanosensitive channel protein MscL [Sandaracinobacteroides hominis]|uniref:large conductance mechanosensitive channel protein MscL n=1 Tax=Sandaracinobacteroides hominis TaxID=2780086 RepID=UPI0018F77848|nr:large conductance mechanosensitive channel protein MscL [Sandaracinobacteroides hominis]
MSMLQEFKAFISRGNVLDLAVGVIIGGAFGTIVKSLTEDLIMPLVSAVTGSPDFTSNFIRLGPVPAGVDPTNYAALKEAGVAMLGYGAFATALLNFLILAFAVFLIVKYANRFFATLAPPPPPPTEEVLLLREIRDNLKK